MGRLLTYFQTLFTEWYRDSNYCALHPLAQERFVLDTRVHVKISAQSLQDQTMKSIAGIV